MNKIVVILLVLGAVQWWFKDPTIDTYTNDVSFNYVVKYSGNANHSDKLPMLIALHGNGDTPLNFYETALDQLQSPARIILLEGPISFGSGSAWPWKTSELNKFGKGVSEVVEILSAKFATKEKPILLGYSGGGMMAYYQALKHGHNYSYIFSVSGQLNKELIENESSNPGAAVFAYHGKSDRIVSINGGRSAAKLLQERGVNINFVEFPGGHHGMFTDMKKEITQAIEKKINILL